MEFCSTMEQNCYHVPKRTTLSDIVSSNGPCRSSTGQIQYTQSTLRVESGSGLVNGTLVLLGLGTKSLSCQ
jgi:hypothetical protein